MPTLGAAQLTAYLRQQGIATKLFDLSAELQDLIIKRGEILPEVGYANGKISILKRYTSIINALFGDGSVPFKLSYDNFTSRWDWKQPDNLTSLLYAHKALFPFIEILPSLPQLESAAYVAFSISFESQIIPALLIAAHIRRQRKISVIFGGCFFYNYTDIFIKVMCTLDIVDCLITGPGEKILESISRIGIKETATSNHFISSTINGKTLFRQKPNEWSPKVYIPDFTDLDFSNYFSPVNAFPYMIRNICYYGGCYFCNGDRDCGTIQSKDVKKAFRSMSKIAKECDIYNVYIVDAALSPHNLKMISDIESPITFAWIANARFENCLNQEDLAQKLRNKGCRMLRFGLESGSQKVLDLMNKGTQVSVAASILQKCHSVGILTHIYLMFGYPGETFSDRIKTLQFLEQNRCNIDSYSVSIFQPMPRTQVYKEIKTRLCLSKKCNADEEYQRILMEVYPSESAYKNILDTIEKVKSIMADFAYTNTEFYSANIFSEQHYCTKKENSLSIQFKPI